MKSNAKILEQRRKSAMERERAAWFKEGYVVLRVNARLAGFPDDAMWEYKRLPADSMYKKRGLVSGWIEQWEKEAEKGQPRALPTDWLSWGSLQQRQNGPAQVSSSELLNAMAGRFAASTINADMLAPWKVWRHSDLGQIDNFRVITSGAITDDHMADAISYSLTDKEPK